MPIGRRGHRASGGLRRRSAQRRLKERPVRRSRRRLLPTRQVRLKLDLCLRPPAGKPGKVRLPVLSRRLAVTKLLLYRKFYGRYPISRDFSHRSIRAFQRRIEAI